MRKSGSPPGPGRAMVFCYFRRIYADENEANHEMIDVQYERGVYLPSLDLWLDQWA